MQPGHNSRQGARRRSDVGPDLVSGPSRRVGTARTQGPALHGVLSLRWFFVLAVAALFAAQGASAAAVNISGAAAASVGTTEFTMVWMTSDVSTPGLDVFSDAAGTTNVSASLALDFFPLAEGDTATSRAAGRALEMLAINRRVVAVHVSACTPGTTYFVRPRTFENAGADNGAGPAPLMAVTTAQLTSFVVDARLLSVRFPGFASEGAIALVHGPAGTRPVVAIVGDSAAADTAIFNLANLLDESTGTNALFALPQQLSITVLGAGAPPGAFLHTVNFAATFGVATHETFVAGATSPAPFFTTHPLPQAVFVGQTAMFTAAAVGDPAPAYRWQRLPIGGAWGDLANDATYSGVTTATLTVAHTTQAMSGDQYRCLASNGVVPDATSNAATLTVTLGTGSVTLSNLAQTYDGTPKTATATTDPVGIAVTITYDGSATPPTNAGSYAVVASLTEPGYTGSTSGTLVIAKAAQTITFAAPADRTFGDAPFAISATTDSSLPVTFAVASGPATIAGNTVTLTGAGVVTLRATQAGNGNFLAAPSVERSFTVAPAVATVTLNGLAQTYSGTPRGVSGLTNPGGLDVVVTYDGSAVAPTDPGSYAIVATVLHANYTGSAAGVLVVAKAPAIARADNKAKIQGATNPPLTITFIGLLNGESTSVLDSLPLASTTALADSLAGTYAITVSGGADNHYEFTRQAGTLTITSSANTAPAINVQPLSQSAPLHTPVTLRVEASGTPVLSYQWFKNAVAIVGQTNATLAFASVAIADGGSYSVRVTNDHGHAVSAIATLTVTLPPGVPTITTEPADLTVKRKARATFRVTAVGSAPLSYQWRKGTTPIAGATARTFVITNVQPTDAGLFSVVVTNPAGTATSRDARLTVTGRSYAGTYFGHFGNNGGTCAFYIRDDNSGVFCGYARGSRVPLFTRDCHVDDNGRFRFSSGPRSVLPPGMASADPVYDFDLQIADDGSVAGTITGLNLTVAAALSPDTGATQDVAGFYQSGAENSGDVTYTVVGSAGEAYVVAIVGSAVDAGLGTVDASGNVDIVTENNAVVDAAVNGPSDTITTTITPAVGAPVTFSGANHDVRADVEKLINISTRGPTQTGDSIVIAGFVVSGTQPKTVLLRAIGPTLTTFGLPGALPAANLRLYAGSNQIASAGDWGAATNVNEIAAASARVSAFPLAFDSHDSAMLITLQPGAYTAHVFGPNGETGVSLVEVYDATDGPIAPDERVINISTRGLVGTNDDVQIAGFVIQGSVPKRVLIRGLGPALAPYLGGYLADPTITLYDVDGSEIIGNDDWGSGGDVASIQEVSAQVQAFPLNPGSQDAVLLLNLLPGIYTVHVRGANGTTGIALVEVYDAP